MVRRIGPGIDAPTDWLFPEGEGPSAGTVFPKRQIAEMHRRFRAGPAGAVCGGCRHFGRWSHHDKAYSKCDVYGHTCGPGSDWNRRWPACGAFAVPDVAPEGETDLERHQRRWRQYQATARGQH